MFSLTGNNVKILISDNGGEYGSTSFNNWLASTGIVHQYSNRYTPLHNGVSERSNRTIMEPTRSALHMRKNKNESKFKKADKNVIELWGGISSKHSVRSLSCAV